MHYVVKNQILNMVSGKPKYNNYRANINITLPAFTVEEIILPQAIMI